MDLDPRLAELAAMAVPPTSLLVNYLSVGTRKLGGRSKPAVAFVSALLFIVCQQGYTGQLTSWSWNEQLFGYPIAALGTMITAGFLAEMQKRAEAKKAERKA